MFFLKFMKVNVEAKKRGNNVKFHYNDGISYYIGEKRATDFPYFVLIEITASCKPLLWAFRVIVPELFFACIIASKRPLYALQ